MQQPTNTQRFTISIQLWPDCDILSSKHSNTNVYVCVCVCVCVCHLPTVPDLISLTFPAVFGKILSYSAKRCRNSSFTVPSLILISHLGDGNLQRLHWFIRIGLYNSDSQTLRGNKKSMSHHLHTQSLTNTQSISHLVLLTSKEKNLNY